MRPRVTKPAIPSARPTSARAPGSGTAANAWFASACPMYRTLVSGPITPTPSNEFGRVQAVVDEPNCNVETTFVAVRSGVINAAFVNWLTPNRVADRDASPGFDVP